MWLANYSTRILLAHGMRLNDYCDYFNKLVVGKASFALSVLYVAAV